MSVKIVVFITPEPSCVENLSDLFLTLREKTLPEEGCYEFDIYQHEGAFVLIEEWKNQQAIDFHMKQPYTQLFIKKTKDKILKTEVKHLLRLT